jgi:hypothetical protein
MCSGGSLARAILRYRGVERRSSNAAGTVNLQISNSNPNRIRREASSRHAFEAAGTRQRQAKGTRG